MGRGKNLNRLRELDDDILAEVVREAEARIAAQFEAATAADQRALTWAGFILTITLATSGATATLLVSGKLLPLAVIGAIFSALLSVSAFLAIRTVRPSKFALPGNLPENWLPEMWEAGQDRNWKQARIEQAHCLNDQIDDNVEWAAEKAKQLSESMALALVSVILASAYSLGYVILTVVNAGPLRG